MKRQVFTFILLLVVSYLSAQNSFTLEITEDTGFLHLTSSAYSQDHYFIGGEIYIGTRPKSFILKVSSSGEIIDTVYFSSNNKDIRCRNIYAKDGVLTAYLLIKGDVELYKYAYIKRVELDSHLTIIREDSLEIPYPTFRANRLKTEKNGTDVYMLVRGPSDNYYDESFLIKTDSAFSTFEYLVSEPMHLFDFALINDYLYIAAIWEENSVHIYKYNIHTHEFVQSVNPVGDIPNAPAVIHYSPLYLSQLSDSTIGFVAYIVQYTGQTSHFTSIFTTDLDNVNYALSSQEYDEEPFFYHALSKNDSGYLFTGYYFVNPHWVVIIKYDKNLNPVWEKLYNFNTIFLGNSIEATPDGGCIIVGDNFYDKGYIIKIDANGNFSTTNTPEIKPTELLLYPNPGSTQLNIRTAVQATGGTFNLYDMQGRMVLSETITDTHTPINTTELAPGSYIFQYVLKGVLRESGKWMKN